MCSVEDYARGGYTTAHALRFLAPSGLSPMVWSTGTTLNDGLEFDFAALRQRRDNYPAFLFGEAKSHGPFKPRDFDRGRSLLNLFPDATMVFATLEEHFSEAEREAAVQLARPITQSARDVPSDARVILLTRLELLHPQGPPYCWEETEGRSETIARTAKSYVRDDLPTWADITLQLHAAVGPHHDWMMEQLDRVRPARRSPRRR
jgi:hypothetical protein